MATEYVVLKLADDADDVAWFPVGRSPITAVNDQAAIRAATRDMTPADKAGTFVATPSRSFRPRTRTVETKEVDRWA